MTAKSFLLQECANTKSVLEETLRFEYGIAGSRDFYDECSVRLAFITSELSAAAEDDFAALDSNQRQLLELTKLISRIERSSLGQYSWPFVSELQKITAAICAEETIDGPLPPMVHVLSDGGLDAYQIFPEQQRPSAGKRRILNIVFPRTLKHFVLLHSILGHEIGHAIWRSTKHQAVLRDALVKAFGAHDCRFCNDVNTLDWLFSPTAPAEVRANLAVLAQRGVDRNNFFQWANWHAWLEEILCDLIGVLTFGPSFIAAECHLLYSIDLKGVGIGNAHPLVACRVNLLLTAAKLLGFRDQKFANVACEAAFQAFWVDLDSTVKPDAWFNIFTEAEISSALDGIGDLLRAHKPAAYQAPESAKLEHLFDQLTCGVPPVGFDVSQDGRLETLPVDFRDILYAGWLVTKHPSKVPFFELNRLCEHGIMQQSAIEIFNS